MHVCQLSDASQHKHATQQLLNWIRQDYGQNSVQTLMVKLCISVCSYRTVHQRKGVLWLLCLLRSVHVS